MIPADGQPILTAAAMRAAEAAAAGDATLMARAGDAVAAAVRRLAAGAEVLVLCGPGKNGGDGYIAAAALAATGTAVRVAAHAPPRGDAAVAARAGWTGRVEPLADAAPAPILVDALFGTGLARPLSPEDAAALRRLRDAARLTIAVDLPSGVASDDGAILGDAVGADVTLALAALKPAHLLQPAARLMGRIRVLDIGVGASGTVHAIAPPTLPRPGPDSHKYSRGMVVVVPGAMAGAGALAATAAARAGVGYVLLLDGGAGAPHALVRRGYDAAALTDRRVGAVVIGPGLGRDAEARRRLDDALAAGRPLVVDGDALHLVDPERLQAAGVPMILTPHQGEFLALFGDLPGSKIDRALAAARLARAVVVYKGADTVIAAPDGRSIVAGDASDWLSTAGTGDVLAGAIGAMLAGGLDPFAAAAAGVWLHGEAARWCGAAFVADDLTDALGAARAAR